MYRANASRLCVFISVSVVALSGADAASPQEHALAHLERLGAAVYRDEKDPRTVVGIHITTGASKDVSADLEPFPELNNLALIKVPITDNGMRRIGALKKLKILIIEDVPLTDDLISHLAGLRNLEFLSLENTGITEASLPYIAKLRRLEALFLSYNPIAAGGFAPLRKLTNLHTLVLADIPVKDQDLEHLLRLKSLNTLWLSNTQITDAGIKYFRKLPKLPGVVLMGAQLSPAGATELRTVLREAGDSSTVERAPQPHGPPKEPTGRDESRPDRTPRAACRQDRRDRRFRVGHGRCSHPPGSARGDSGQDRGGNRRHLPKEFTNSVGIKFRLIPAGRFMMGSPETRRISYESPMHKVRISKPFYLAVTEVTQGQWKKVMGTAPWSDNVAEEEGFDYVVKEGADYAATYISWNDAREFCKKLNAELARSPATGPSPPRGYRYALPTEAQWEYACRAGSNAAYSFGNYSPHLGSYAWYNDNAWNVGEKYAHRVALKRPNAWGLYDMHGNVAECCNDWYDDDYYERSPAIDPTGRANGYYHVYRGGAWASFAQDCRSAARSDAALPSTRSSMFGFRVELASLPDH